MRKRFGQPMPFIFIKVLAPKYRIRPVPIELLVDTGSPWIAISPKDSTVLNIPIPALKKASEYPEVSLAGYKFWRFLMKDVSIHLRDEAEKMVPIDLSSISVLVPTKTPFPDEIKHIPSVLGDDFLMNGRFSLHFDPNKGAAFLEREGLK